MGYSEYLPSAALQPYVACFWKHEVAMQEQDVYRCVPTGNTDIMFELTYSGQELLKRDSGWELMPKAFLTGLWTGPAEIKMSARVERFGIRFKPEGFVQMFRQPLREMGNAALDPQAVFGKQWDDLHDQIVHAADLPERIALAERWLLRRLRAQPAAQSYLSTAISLIRQHGGGLSTDALASQVFVSPRQLQRTFQAQYGLSPKQYARIIRFNRVNQLLRNQAKYSWTAITYDCGYSDQAHFIREFREFSGTTPTVLVANPIAYALPQTGFFRVYQTE